VAYGCDQSGQWSPAPSGARCDTTISRARSEDRVKALRAGFQIHLAKPIDPAELVTTSLRSQSGSALKANRSDEISPAGDACQSRISDGETSKLLPTILLSACAVQDIHQSVISFVTRKFEISPVVFVIGTAAVHGFVHVVGSSIVN